MSRKRYNHYGYDYYPPSSPKEVKGGIKASSNLGGSSWWAKRWIAVLESFNIGQRLARGRSYARRGQVISIEVNKGKISANVQGSRKTPYKIEIQVKELTSQQWEKLVQILSTQAIFAAKLLAGQMPQDIEDAFKKAGFSLFPQRSNDLNTNCSCPDWSNPCKHIAAVYYLLGEEFDRDPFLIFKLRGLDKEELTGLLSPATKTSTKQKSKSSYEKRVSKKQEDFYSEPLKDNHNDFWNGKKINEDIFNDVYKPSLPAPLLKQLGKFPFWRGKHNLSELVIIYNKSASFAIGIFINKPG